MGRRDERGNGAAAPTIASRPWEKRAAPAPLDEDRSSGPGTASRRRSEAATRAKKRPQQASKRLTPPDAEEMLRRALLAQTTRSRALWAKRGLSLRGPLDVSTHGLLLRQLYLARYEDRRFEQAVAIAKQMVDLGVLPDVAHQDAARASVALGDLEGALGHLRLATRIAPPSRRAFHWWTLGSVLHLAGRHDEAIAALSRALRWGTTDKPLYLGHLAVVQRERGVESPELGPLIAQLAAAPAGQGYGRFVLGHLAFLDGRWDEARAYLEAFVRRSSSGRAILAISLEGEISRARETLARLPPS
ncbi:tetratricopeptide repeat protein [Chondromyces apiculatus]|uniref:Uncharacterized protein n=1 Tax=Chondromyces apiculatus DSM 436 TaxID=1192034 RepID=A0A017T4P1_9BACT|nr:tetratricopeptide repeat protein [Chondromyces apiculatus]EYF04228.1 Hypothetical protein CAP_4705 [Chondromyces apiculatus DSM 436]